jgi:hypothetical protein
MQAITWSEEEFQASVSAKLTLLRAYRQQDAQFNLHQRLELAQDRAEFAERQRLAQAARQFAARQASPSAGMSGCSGQPPIPSGSGGDLFLQRLEDDPPPDQGTPNDEESADNGESAKTNKKQPHRVAKVRPDMSHAVDSHATSIALKPARASTFVSHAIRYQAAQKAGVAIEPADITPAAFSLGAKRPAPLYLDDGYTELPSDKARVRPASLYAEDPEPVLDAAQIQRRRLVEQTQRQSSAAWVVIDRATALNCLSQRPAGLTITDLATLLLGSAASARDTRRLSGLMKREEERATIAHAGRGSPITITAKGKAELSAMDINTAAIAAVEKRQKRVNSQARRLILGG